jgi:hypothetical protein
MEYEPAAAVAALTVAEGWAGPPGGGGYSLVLHNGDLAYSRGYSALWDAFLFRSRSWRPASHTWWVGGWAGGRVGGWVRTAEAGGSLLWWSRVGWRARGF